MKTFFPDYKSSVFAFITDRSMDFSLRDDRCPLTPQQRQYIMTHAGDVPMIHIRQVHGDEVVVVDQHNKQTAGVMAEADALITDQPQVALAIRTADCLPVFIYDTARPAIGLVHAGWSSTRKNIVGKTVRLMTEIFHSRPEEMRVAFGPAIGHCCYEVGEAFLGYFPQTVQLRDGRYFFDIARENQHQLMAQGVRDGHIFDCALCTVCDPDYFSYRREGSIAGRMISLMMIKEGCLSCI